MRRSLIHFGVSGLILFSVVVAPVAYWFYEADRPFREARHLIFHDLDYRAVSSCCFDLLTQPQYKPLIDEDRIIHDPRLPMAIRNMKPIDITIDTNADRVIIFMTSGFKPMGVIFRQSATYMNAYDLVFRDEPPPNPDRLLYTYYLPTNAHGYKPGPSFP